MLKPNKINISVPESIAKQLSDGTFKGLETSISNLESWIGKLPLRSCFYMNEEVTFRAKTQVPPNFKYMDVVTADVLFDIHSVYAAQCLAKSWRTLQLVEGLLAAFTTWNTTVAAAIARALTETASCWAVESHEISLEWQKARKTRVESVNDVMQVRDRLYEAIIQSTWATRLPRIAKRSKQFQRTNILTFIEKAAKKESFPELKEQYDVLCDAVHPSWGSNECFWRESGIETRMRQMRVLLERNSVGWLGSTEGPVRPGSQLPAVIVSCSGWAVDTLARSLPAFDRTCRDLCLTAKIFLLSNLDYWGIVKPTGTYELCACGSGKKSRFCIHKFGEPD